MSQEQRALPPRAREADSLLNGEVMAEVWEHAEATFVREWMNAETVERREMAHAKVVGLAEVRRLLRAIISDGEYGSRAQNG